MTLYEKILQYDVEDLAEFIYGLISGTEERCLEMLHKNGIEASFVSIAPELQIAENVMMLMQEVGDDT